MGWLLFIMFIAVANLALGAGVAIATGDAPPLREIVDGIVYDSYDDELSSDTTAAADDDANEDNANEDNDDKGEDDSEAAAEAGDDTAEGESAG